MRQKLGEGSTVQCVNFSEPWQIDLFRNNVVCLLIVYRFIPWLFGLGKTIFRHGCLIVLVQLPNLG